MYIIYIYIPHITHIESTWNTTRFVRKHGHLMSSRRQQRQEVDVDADGEGMGFPAVKWWLWHGTRMTNENNEAKTIQHMLERYNGITMYNCITKNIGMTDEKMGYHRHGFDINKLRNRPHPYRNVGGTYDRKVDFKVPIFRQNHIIGKGNDPCGPPNNRSNTFQHRRDQLVRWA